jgi:hypothetical protein
MAATPTKVRLQKTLKEGLRRCIYRRWEATVKGAILTTRTTELERLYRGNTPYPIGKAKATRRAYNSPPLTKAALQRELIRRKAEGYRVA